MITAYGELAPLAKESASIIDREPLASETSAIELGGISLAYADAWARLQCQKPMAPRARKDGYATCYAMNYTISCLGVFEA